MPTESSAHAESSSMDAELNLTDSETESDEEASKINARNQEEGQAGPNPGVQDEGQAGPNPGVQDEGQARPNPGIAAESQLQSSHVVHAGPNLKHMDLGTSDASTQQKPEQMDEEFTTTAYPNVQENLKLLTKDQEEEPGKTNAEADVQSMVSVPIHQDTSLVLLMTTPIIDLTTMQSDSPLPTSTTTTLIIITTSLLPPPQPQQSTTDSILVSRIDWAMQAPLRVRFRDLPTVDMKEIRQQRMFEDDSYNAHTIHNDLYEALQNPPTPPLLGGFSMPGTSGASGSSQLPPPPPPPSTGTSGSAQQQGNKAPQSPMIPFQSSRYNSIMMMKTLVDLLIQIKSCLREKTSYVCEQTMPLPLAKKLWHPTVNSLLARVAYEDVNAFYQMFRSPLVTVSGVSIDAQDQVDWANLEGDQYTQLNLTKSGWDSIGYKFKHDYTIIESPRVVVFSVNNNERKFMRFNEIYKFSDSTLMRILEALAYRVKEFKIKRLNLGTSSDDPTRARGIYPWII
ncbi:hypothetical protein Tco_0770938 [Tanacetum coccineum]|uniref:Uncharacterized protein n=1 Tax=Tanacetum coccineum TaxID=301880 RepID=A0ABQ4ZH57_9ASTR